jgi:ComF family protein
MISVLRKATEALASLFYPAHCVNCEVPLDEHGYLCTACGDSAWRIKPPFCAVCSQPFEGAIGGQFSCVNCSERRFHFDCAVSAYRSRGVVRELIHRFKYNQELYLRHPLAEWLAGSLDDPRIASRPFDFFVPVPLHPVRLREREFNQSRVLAEMLSAKTGAPVLDCLRRVRQTRTQTRFDRAERMENLLNAFEARMLPAVQDQRLLLVDDVLTTGSTVAECARVLIEAGAASVRVITVARG